MWWHVQRTQSDIQMVFAHLHFDKGTWDLLEFSETFPEEY